MNNHHTAPKLLNYLQQIPILIYHKIDPRSEIGINAISPKQFRRQMEWLHHHQYQAITFNDLQNSASLPQKPVIITFDDGYESVYEYALPITASMDMRASVYIISAFVGKKNIWDLSLDGRRFSHLSKEQIRDLCKNKWEVGAHSVTHRALPYLPEHEAYQEIEYSKKSIEDLTGQPVISFAYPFGLQTKREMEIVRECGFQYACKGIRGKQSSTVFDLQRYPVYSTESLKSFRKKLHHPVPTAHRLKLLSLGLPVYIMPIYQKIFNRQLKLDHM